MIFISYKYIYLDKIKLIKSKKINKKKLNFEIILKNNLQHLYIFEH